MGKGEKKNEIAYFEYQDRWKYIWNFFVIVIMIASSFLLFSDDACVKVNRQCRARTIVKRRALSSDSYTHTYLELMSNSNHIVNLGIPWKKKKEKQETADSGKSESS